MKGEGGGRILGIPACFALALSCINYNMKSLYSLASEPQCTLYLFHSDSFWILSRFLHWYGAKNGQSFS